MRPKISAQTALIENIGRGNPFLWDWISLSYHSYERGLHLGAGTGFQWAQHLCGRKELYNIFISQARQLTHTVAVARHLLGSQLHFYKKTFIRPDFAVVEQQ